MAPYLKRAKGDAMTRRDRRALRERMYHLARDVHEVSRSLEYKTSNESGALQPPVRHPGRRRWGGESGLNKNGNPHKFDRNRRVYVRFGMNAA